MKTFTLQSPFAPAGDQPEAISHLSASLKAKHRYQTLVGVTGSGKTYTMANLIQKTQRPTLIMTHNKTLAAQLYHEFKGFFPNNHVEYFISYYDYYQPEAYLPRQDLFIEKDSAINAELERMRLSATASILSYQDVICVASVSANYGLGNPHEYQSIVQSLEVGQRIAQKQLLLRFVEMGYTRNDTVFEQGSFRVMGDVVDIYPAYSDKTGVHLEFFGDEVESITHFEVLSRETLDTPKRVVIYAANQFIVSQTRLKKAISSIEIELKERLLFFQQHDQLLEYNRLKQRVEFDLEMMEATGMCKGIENYSRHLTGKQAGETPYCLLDYFEAINQEYLLIVDESHVSLPQFRGMYAGDQSRKKVLVDYGFRLPSALDNRPLRFEEFITKAPAYLFVSATPSEQELSLSEDQVVQQIIRPTGLLDPTIEIVPSKNQIEDLYDRAKEVIAKDERILVTVLTKKMAEELSRYYLELGLKAKYMHSEIDTIERNEIIRGLRLGQFDMLIGINLLREGLDLPEVSLIAIIDADKEGFLRSETALIQTMGRAARNLHGHVLLFADTITRSMRQAMDITHARRQKQEAFNHEQGITPKSVSRKLDATLNADEDFTHLIEDTQAKMPASERKKRVANLRQAMQEAAKNLEFEKAASLRDQIALLKKL